MAMASSSSLGGPPARSWEMMDSGHSAGLFTEAELAAADQLVQLSGNGCGGDDAASSSSSPRSVNTCAAGAAWKEEVARAGGPPLEELDRRVTKRYRLLSDLYAATGPATTGAFLGASAAEVTASGGSRKRKRDAKAAMARYGDQSW